MKKTKKIISLIIFLISILLFIILYYLKNNYSWTSFDQLLFSIQNAEGTNSDIILRGISYVALKFIIIVSILIIIRLILKRIIRLNDTQYKMCIRIDKFNINIKLYLFNRIVMSIIVFILTLLFIVIEIGIPSYINNKRKKSTVFENYYVDPKNTKIVFKEKKKNLIFIYVESLEVSGLSINVGGSKDISITPNLEELAIENTNFSSTNTIGGFVVPDGAGWTSSAMVAQTAGIPLKTGNLNGNDYNSSHFLSGAFSLGDILEDNGYKNYILMGSDAGFGGRKNYFKEHGNYEIKDYKWAKKEKLIAKDYLEWWGFEDLKLFEFAKSELTKISDSDEPFNFTILTADTHPYNGYMDSTCSEIFDDKYSNSYYCNDEKINNFINWIREQDFYENTTIIITGDHLNMQKDFFSDSYDRKVYNVIINGPEIEMSKTKNREFTSFDIYPTTLASIGATITGDRLGLGTNLYSSKKTLIEELGHDYFIGELNKDSDYYKQNILKSDYLNMYKEERR